MTSYIVKNAPKDQLDKLIPDYRKQTNRSYQGVYHIYLLAPGCKRILVDPDYLKALHRPNLSLKWDAIDSIVENGIKLKTGEIVPLDVIIFGTGYSLASIKLATSADHSS